MKKYKPFKNKELLRFHGEYYFHINMEWSLNKDKTYTDLIASVTF